MLGNPLEIQQSPFCCRLHRRPQTRPLWCLVWVRSLYAGLRPVLQDPVPCAAHEGHRRGRIDPSRADGVRHTGGRVQRGTGHRGDLAPAGLKRVDGASCPAGPGIGGGRDRARVWFRVHVAGHQDDAGRLGHCDHRHRRHLAADGQPYFASDVCSSRLWCRGGRYPASGAAHPTGRCLHRLQNAYLCADGHHLESGVCGRGFCWPCRKSP